MRDLYNMTAEDVADPDASVAPFAQAESKDGFGEKDLLKFQELCGFAPNPLHEHLGDGPYTPKYDDDEANLDVQMLTTFGVNSTLDFFIVNSDQWMYEYTLQIAGYLANGTTIPWVNSMSYAWMETQECANKRTYPFLGQCKAEGIPNSKVYVNRTNTEFMKFTSMGYTFVAASGDDGTGGTHSSSNCSFTHPLFPAASPWVLSVGATVTAPGDKTLPGNWPQPICNSTGKDKCTCNTQGNEVMCGSDTYGYFDSGGGFSVDALQPVWQAQAVNTYLASSAKKPCDACFNAAGRGYPDVAALGGNIGVYDGSVSLIGGTSASCPIVGGMISTLNAIRLKAGKTTLGYVNPMLYQAALDCPKCFTDITGSGTNSGGCPDMGFEVTTGWDPTTGLGSVNFGNLRDYIAANLA